MRRMLVAAVALGPLVVASGAYAQTVVSDTRTTPIATATADEGSNDDVQIASGGGSITLSSGTAVTLNSDNDVIVGGTIVMEDADDGATAILAEGGNTGSITVSGRITITDDLDESKDLDDDGDPDTPYATGTDRYGIRVTGPGPLIGDIEIQNGATIGVEGNQSYAISIEGGLDGDFTTDGSISATGNESYGVRATGAITGDVLVSGAIGAIGEDAVAVSFEDNIGGALTVDGNLRSTGYRTTTVPSVQEALDNLDADDLLVGGPALRVAGDVAGGVLLEAAQPDLDPDEDDEDGDGIVDTSETTSFIASFGSAPAVEIGSATRGVTLGEVGTGEEAYGFINRGEIQAHGLFEGFSATAVQIGVDAGQATDILGGVRNQGAISTSAVEEEATGIRIGAGASTPVVINNGSLQAQMAGDGAFNAIGVDIDAAASVPAFVNTGLLTVGVGGETGNAYGIRDASGGLTSIENTGRIQALVIPTPTEAEPNPVVTGRGIAIDVSANTSGVTLVQDAELSDPDLDLPDADGDGVWDIEEPLIEGEIRLGSASDVVDIRNGSTRGRIDFGDGADSLIISSGADVRGVLADSDGLLDITVSNGTLDAQQTAALAVTSLDVGADGTLIFTVDPQNNTSGGFLVNGTATLADGASVGVRFQSLLDGPERYTVIDATTLNFGDIDVGSIARNSPFLYVVDVDADVAAGEMYVDVRRRTAQEADFIAVEEAAYDSIYAALGASEALQNVFLAQSDRDGFMNLYEQMLPDHSGGPLMSLASGLDAVTRALAGRSTVTPQGETSAWLQEINFYAEKDQEQAYGFESEGFGLAGGIERGTRLGAVGISVAFTSSDLEDPEAEAEEQLSARLIELGLYWRLQRQNWSVWARGAAGYATFDATRQFVGGGLVLRNESSWSGFTAAAAAGASYERQFGRFSIRPEVRAEYFMLSEEDRIESGGGDGFDLIIDERDGHIFSATAAVNFGASFGQDQWFRPEFHLGWRQNFSYDAGLTTARFASGGPAFILAADTIEGGGPVAGFRLNFGNAMGALSLEGDAEMIDEYVRYSLLLRATFRF